MNEYRMPAEWEPQAFVQLTWPHKDTDWAPILHEITETYVEMADAITKREGLLIVHPQPEEVKTLLETRLTREQQERISYFQCDTDDTWARDHGFITLVKEEREERREEREHRLLDFQFNGWGKKFEATKDNAINRQLAKDDNRYENHLDFVLEGGSIESDGRGTIFTTSCCLLAPNRNETTNLSNLTNVPTGSVPLGTIVTTGTVPLGTFEGKEELKERIEEELKRRLRARRVVWLDCEPMAGDDTDGHIDTMVRLAPNDTLLYNREENFEEQLKALRTLDGRPYRLLELPLPQPIYEEEFTPGEAPAADATPLPATYANFLVLNGAVLVPTYNQPDNDAAAIRIIQEAFPDHEMVPIDSRQIIRQHGSIHCCTMQYPAGLSFSKCPQGDRPSGDVPRGTDPVGTFTK